MFPAAVAAVVVVVAGTGLPAIAVVVVDLDDGEVVVTLPLLGARAGPAGAAGDGFDAGGPVVVGLATVAGGVVDGGKEVGSVA